MDINWITSDLEGEPVEVITRIIITRNKRTSAYKTGGALLCNGLFVYGIAVAKMLIFTNT